MFKFDFDKETHGILLSKKSNVLSREVRPVYAKEMLNRGFDEYWNFDHDDSAPIMWAIFLDFYYDGELMISLKNAKNLHETREIKYLNKDSLGDYLKHVDIDLMIKKNNSILKQIEDQALNDIYKVYKMYEDEVDLISVAYSGGKDSEVVLNLCMRILPRNKYLVSGNNTGLETNNSVLTVKERKKNCKDLGINFVEGNPKINSEDAGKKIGPPALANRGCCYVLKSTPVVMKFREMINKEDINVLCYLGNRIDESSKRANLKLVSGRVKNKETINCNPIAEWSSAEVFLYLYKYNINFNQGYIEGHNRIGCAVCPLTPTDSLNYFYSTNKDEADKGYNIVKSAYSNNSNQEGVEHVIDTSIGTNRYDAEGTNYSHKYKEYMADNNLCIEYTEPNMDGKLGLKTIGKLEDNNKISFRSKSYTFEVFDRENGTKVVFKDLDINEDAKFIEIIKSVFRKATFCVMCHECEVRCKKGNISFSTGHVEISDNCNQCLSCHEVPSGCFACKSRRYTKDCR